MRVDLQHFDLGGIYLVIIAGFPALPRADEARFPMVTFSVPNLEIACEKLRAGKVEIPWGIESDRSGRWVMFHDPAANLVELVQWK